MTPQELVAAAQVTTPERRKMMTDYLEGAIETVRGHSEMISLSLPAAAVHQLSRWASVGRSIDEAVRWLDNMVENSEDEQATEAVPYAVDELLTLKYALNACGMAAHSWLLTPEGKQWFKEAGEPRLGTKLTK